MIIMKVTGVILQRRSNVVFGFLLHRKRFVRRASFHRLKGWGLASKLAGGRWCRAGVLRVARAGRFSSGWGSRDPDRRLVGLALQGDIVSRGGAFTRRTLGRVIRRRDPIRRRASCLRVPLRRVGGRVSGAGREGTIASLNAVARLRLPLGTSWPPRGGPRGAVSVSGDKVFAGSNAVKGGVLVGGGCFANVDCATLGATGVCHAGRPWSSRLLAQGLRIVSALDLCHQLVGHLPVLFQGMERGEEWGSNPVDRAGVSHCGIHGVDVGLGVGVGQRRGGLRRGLVQVGLAEGVGWWSGWSVVLLRVGLGHVVGGLRHGWCGGAPGLEGSVGGGRAVLELALGEDLHDRWDDRHGLCLDGALSVAGGGRHVARGRRAWGSGQGLVGGGRDGRTLEGIHLLLSGSVRGVAGHGYTREGTKERRDRL